MEALFALLSSLEHASRSDYEIYLAGRFFSSVTCHSAEQAEAYIRQTRARTKCVRSCGACAPFRKHCVTFCHRFCVRWITDRVSQGALGRSVVCVFGRSWGAVITVLALAHETTHFSCIMEVHITHIERLWCCADGASLHDVGTML